MLCVTPMCSGCGSLNNGSKTQLLAAFKKIGELPRRTLLYPGHEYTYMNFAYASTVEPLNSKMLDKRAWVSICPNGTDIGVILRFPRYSNGIRTIFKRFPALLEKNTIPLHLCVQHSESRVTLRSCLNAQIQQTHCCFFAETRLIMPGATVS